MRGYVDLAGAEPEPDPKAPPQDRSEHAVASVRANAIVQLARK
jgi:hypothetical protein